MVIQAISLNTCVLKEAITSAMTSFSPDFSKCWISGVSKLIMICFMSRLSKLQAKLLKMYTHRWDQRVSKNVCRKLKSKYNHKVPRNQYPILIAVSILSPVKTQIFIPAWASLSMQLGTWKKAKREREWDKKISPICSFGCVVRSLPHFGVYPQQR